MADAGSATRRFNGPAIAAGVFLFPLWLVAAVLLPLFPATVVLAPLLSGVVTGYIANGNDEAIVSGASVGAFWGVLVSLGFVWVARAGTNHPPAPLSLSAVLQEIAPYVSLGTAIITVLCSVGATVGRRLRN